MVDFCFYPVRPNISGFHGYFDNKEYKEGFLQKIRMGFYSVKDFLYINAFITSFASLYNVFLHVKLLDKHVFMPQNE